MTYASFAQHFPVQSRAYPLPACLHTLTLLLRVLVSFRAATVTPVMFMVSASSRIFLLRRLRLCLIVCCSLSRAVVPYLSAITQRESTHAAVALSWGHSRTRRLLMLYVITSFLYYFFSK